MNSTTQSAADSAFDLHEDDGPVHNAIARLEPFLKAQIDAHPYRTLAVVLLAGFTVGGGFSSRIGQLALVVAARYASKNVWRGVAANLLGD